MGAVKPWLWGRWSKFGFLIALATLALDQASKWWLLSVFRIAEKGRVQVTPFFDLVFVRNEGVSYGIGAGYLGQEALAVFAAAAALALAVWLARSGSSWVMAASIGLIIGGAISNGIDRLHLGGVADFFSLHAFGFYWYVFNIADVAIVAGVVGLLYDSFWPSRKDAAKAS
ncbi:MAG TPA: signal peptidase II [Hyphomicrobiaceae bacterium]|nr:signal peptidase II [Hyphomicrobiaceae bacterium]